MKRKMVYVAGPLTAGNQDRNVNRAVRAGDWVRAHGGIPLIPHLSTLWAMVSDRPWTYEDWMELDFEYIRRCDALYRLKGASGGSDREVEFAGTLRVPVFYQGVDDEKFIEYLRADLD